MALFMADWSPERDFFFFLYISVQGSFWDVEIFETQILYSSVWSLDVWKDIFLWLTFTFTSIRRPPMHSHVNVLFIYTCGTTVRVHNVHRDTEKSPDLNMEVQQDERTNTQDTNGIVEEKKTAAFTRSLAKNILIELFSPRQSQTTSLCMLPRRLLMGTNCL